jgi:excisionase family DNA binding protein
MSDNPKPVQADIITEEEAAALLRVKRFTMRKWRREGGGPRFIRCGGRLIRYIKTDIDDWLSKNSFSSHAAELRAHLTK